MLYFYLFDHLEVVKWKIEVKGGINQLESILLNKFSPKKAKLVLNSLTVLYLNLDQITVLLNSELR